MAEVGGVHVPPELWDHALSFLEREDIFNMSVVNKTLCRVARSHKMVGRTPVFCASHWVASSLDYKMPKVLWPHLPYGHEYCHKTEVDEFCSAKNRPTSVCVQGEYVYIATQSPCRYTWETGSLNYVRKVEIATAREVWMITISGDDYDWSEHGLSIHLAATEKTLFISIQPECGPEETVVERHSIVTGCLHSSFFFDEYAEICCDHKYLYVFESWSSMKAFKFDCDVDIPRKWVHQSSSGFVQSSSGIMQSVTGIMQSRKYVFISTKSHNVEMLDKHTGRLLQNVADFIPRPMQMASDGLSDMIAVDEVQNKLYLTAGSTQEVRDYLLKVDIESGSIEWKRENTTLFRVTLNLNPFREPVTCMAVFKDRLYMVVGERGIVYCIDTATGHDIGSFKFKTDVYDAFVCGNNLFARCKDDVVRTCPLPFPVKY